MDKTFSVTIPAEIVTRIDAEATSQDRSRASMIRRALGERFLPHEYGGHGVIFETFYHPHQSAAIDQVVANLGALPPESFAAGAKPPAAELARWTARPYESSEAFQKRIRAELTHQGALGSAVSIYEPRGFWERNALGALLPDRTK